MVTPSAAESSADQSLGRILLTFEHRILQAPAGTTLAGQSSPSDSLHVLLEGWASRVLFRADGRRQLFCLLSPGDVADLDTLYEPSLDYGISAFTDCRFAVVSRSDLSRVIQADSDVARATLRAVLSDARRMTRRSVALTCLPARGRVISLLRELGGRYLPGLQAGNERGVAFTMPLTQAEIANLLGLSTVHVNRVMQELRQDGLMRQSNKRLEIPDWDGLVAAARDVEF